MTEQNKKIFLHIHFFLSTAAYVVDVGQQELQKKVYKYLIYLQLFFLKYTNTVANTKRK